MVLINTLLRIGFASVGDVLLYYLIGILSFGDGNGFLAERTNTNLIIFDGSVWTTVVFGRAMVQTIGVVA